MRGERKVRVATLVALTAGGMVCVGPGVAFAGGQDGGASANGGAALADAVQQNTAQAHRQNNNCADGNGLLRGATELMGGRTQTRCVTGDASFNRRTLTEGRGANANGGSATVGTVNQQNVAQKGRQNNSCGSPNDTPITLMGASTENHCVGLDGSTNEDSVTRSGGANANGGSGGAFLDQQDTAQEGRQNNNCADIDTAFVRLTGAETDGRCVDQDSSVNRHMATTGKGATANGGSASAAGLVQQNTAQEGRQNNNCADPIAGVVLTGSQAEGHCLNRDGSVNENGVIKGGGATANGGSSLDDDLLQQNTAQEGRQNNNCANPNNAGINGSGGSARGHCANHDGSLNRDTVVKGGGAEANGGSGGSFTPQQNTAQEGRQNNNCANPNGSELDLIGASAEADCTNHDGSLNQGTLVKGGGAEANGGSAVGGLSQQNTAQEGRQNNNCANPNSTTLALTGASSTNRCATDDRSANVDSADIGGGAEANGGSGLLDLTQQNTAQEGRQNNSCGNPNGLSITASGSRNSSQCEAVDESTNVGTVTR
ncbi:hypothetical protein GCM10010521_01270 [Streptomyces rameus]|uniref:Secreted protein n=1 Tax=Streptomyces rameus TaxID=68261 RepID=A0ABP6MM54_9ACTN